MKLARRWTGGGRSKTPFPEQFRIAACEAMAAIKGSSIRRPWHPGRACAVCLAAALVLLAGCAPPAVEAVYACLEERLPGRLGFAAWPNGTHITIKEASEFSNFTRIWIAESRRVARSIEGNRKSNRTMGLFGMYYSGGVERQGYVVVEFPTGKVPETFRQTVLQCVR